MLTACRSQALGRPRARPAARPALAVGGQALRPWRSIGRRSPRGQRQQRSMFAVAATSDEEAVDKMKREIEQGDVWDNEIVGTSLKVALVTGIVAVAVFVGNLGKPIVDNTLRSFPNPEQIQAYEESKYLE